MKQLTTVAAAMLLAACSGGEQTLQLQLSNAIQGSNGFQFSEVAVTTSVKPGQGFTAENLSALAIDSNNDGKTDLLQVLAKLPAGASKTAVLTPVEQLPVLTHAELSVRQGGQWQGKAYEAEGFNFASVNEFTAPEQLTDHSYYLRYEGPGWESDQMGYRLYLDWRNGLDIFGKKTTDMALVNAGQDGYDSYHHMSDWGMDLLKVGKSLGLGSIGRMDGDTVMHMQGVTGMSWKLQENGPLQSRFTVLYPNWTVADTSADVSTHYRIHGKDASTQIDVSSSVPLDNLVTGIVNHKGTEFLQARGKHWGYIATWGKQSLAGDDDELGMALFYNLNEVANTGTGEHDYLVHFNAGDSFSYHILAAWPQHPDGTKSLRAFQLQLKEKLKSLDTPMSVSVQ